MSRNCWKNKENCVADALKYNNKSKWIKDSSRAYAVALKNNWILDCCKHMIKPNAWNKKWTKEKCVLEAKKYRTRTDFQKKSSGAYCAAYDNNWLDEICSHMIKTGNIKRRCIYAYEFSNNSVYVGLTYNIEERNSKRKFQYNDAVTKYIKETKLIPNLKQLSEYIQVDIAAVLENDCIEFYRNNSWNILNKIKGGGVGGSTTFWTYDKCKNEALKYKYRNDFKKHSVSAYRISIKNKWLNDICKHMINKYISWTFEKCKECALKYKSKSDFRKHTNGAYNFALKNNWLNIICQHMIIKKKSNNYWSKENCMLEAKKYKTVNELRKKAKSAYVTIINKGWLDDISFLEKYKRI